MAEYTVRKLENGVAILRWILLHNNNYTGREKWAWHASAGHSANKRRKYYEYSIRRIKFGYYLLYLLTTSFALLYCSFSCNYRVRSVQNNSQISNDN